MSDFEFAPALDALRRNLDIEGKTGTELGIGDSGVTLIVLAATDANSRWKAKRKAAGVEIARLENSNAKPERIRARTIELYVDAIVIGWYYVDAEGERHAGPLDPGGNAIPFTREACTAFLTRFDDAYTAVQLTIYDTQKFRGARVEAVVENLKN